MKLRNNILRLAIVGCGRIAPRHAEAIHEIDNSKLIAVCDIKKERADLLSKKYDVKSYYDYAKLLENKEIDIVNICTSSGLHAKMGIMAADKGKHIVVEKPMALSLNDADNLIKACHRNKVKLAVILQNRYNQAMQDLNKIIKKGKIGKINLACVCVRWYRSQEYYNDEWHGTVKMDGGVVMNQSIHHLDALVWLMGMPKSVFAYSGTLAHQIETEDACVAIFKYKNGSLATFEGSTITYPENIEGSIAFFGEKGSVKVGGTALNRKVFWKIKGELDKEREILKKEKKDPKSIYGLSHKEAINDMVKCILEGKEPQNNGEEGRKSLRLVCAIYNSINAGREIFI